MAAARDWYAVPLSFGLVHPRKPSDLLLVTSPVCRTSNAVLQFTT